MTRPTIVAHRGASGYLPEHTLAAYELGLRLGADAFEIDVVPTADGHLVARHENDLTGSTDVAAHPELADRRTIKVIEGVRHMGWFTEDFTLAEIGTLRAREPLPALRSTEHDGQYAVPALPEILTLRAQLAQEMGRPVGLKLEVKSPVHFAGIGHAVEDLLLRDLAAAGMLGPASPVEIMTFDLHHLRLLRERGVENGMVFLVEEDPSRPVPGEAGATYGDLTTPAGLARVRETAQALGPGRHALFTGMPGTPPRRATASLRGRQSSGSAARLLDLSRRKHLPTNGFHARRRPGRARRHGRSRGGIRPRRPRHRHHRPPRPRAGGWCSPVAKPLADGSVMRQP
ncbi:MAG: glycerophosphodiester phosphodiesterase [Actinobacteria bacterium]|nr:glycerophosphodiester phosphodiesterase [Actinomycetota bacterium]